MFLFLVQIVFWSSASASLDLHNIITYSGKQSNRQISDNTSSMLLQFTEPGLCRNGTESLHNTFTAFSVICPKKVTRYRHQALNCLVNIEQHYNSTFLFNFNRKTKTMTASIWHTLQYCANTNPSHSLIQPVTLIPVQFLIIWLYQCSRPFILLDTRPTQ